MIFAVLLQCECFMMSSLLAIGLIKEAASMKVFP